jgi:hypothetical protein
VFALVRFSLIILFALAGGVTLFAQQDTIYLSPEEKITGKVLEISSEKIKVERRNGVVYLLNFKEVFKIVYADGQEESLLLYRQEEYFENKKLTEEFGKNSLSFNLFYVINLGMELHYERYLLQGKLGVKPFFSYHFGSANSSSRDISYGTDFLFYPTGQGRMRYFLGPGVEMGNFSSMMYPLDPMKEPYLDNFNFYFVYLNNGVLFQPSPALSIGLSVGIGIRGDDYRSDAYSGFNFRGNFGFRF